MALRTTLCSDHTFMDGYHKDRLTANETGIRNLLSPNDMMRPISCQNIKLLLKGSSPQNPTYILAVVIASFQSQGNSELTVHKGEEIYILFELDDWAFVNVLSNNTRKGYIPLDYCEVLQDFYGSSPRSARQSQGKPVAQPCHIPTAKRVLFKDPPVSGENQKPHSRTAIVNPQTPYGSSPSLYPNNGRRLSNGTVSQHKESNNQPQSFYESQLQSLYSGKNSSQFGNSVDNATYGTVYGSVSTRAYASTRLREQHSKHKVLMPGCISHKSPVQSCTSKSAKITTSSNSQLTTDSPQQFQNRNAPKACLNLPAYNFQVLTKNSEGDQSPKRQTSSLSKPILETVIERTEPDTDLQTSPEAQPNERSDTEAQPNQRCDTEAQPNQRSDTEVQPNQRSDTDSDRDDVFESGMLIVEYPVAATSNLNVSLKQTVLINADEIPDTDTSMEVKPNVVTSSVLTKDSDPNLSIQSADKRSDELISSNSSKRMIPQSHETGGSPIVLNSISNGGAHVGCCCIHHFHHPVPSGASIDDNYLQVLKYLNHFHPNGPPFANVRSPASQDESGLGDTESIHSSGDLANSRDRTREDNSDSRKVVDGVTQTTKSLEDLTKVGIGDNRTQSASQTSNNSMECSNTSTFSRKSSIRSSRMFPDNRYLMKPISPAKITQAVCLPSPPSESQPRLPLDRTLPSKPMRQSSPGLIWSDVFSREEASVASWGQSEVTSSRPSGRLDGRSVSSSYSVSSGKRSSGSSVFDSEEDRAHLARYLGRPITNSLQIDANKTSRKSSADDYIRNEARARDQRNSSDIMLDPSAIDSLEDANFDELVEKLEETSIDDKMGYAERPIDVEESPSPDASSTTSLSNQLSRFQAQIDRLDANIGSIERGSRLSLPIISGDSSNLHTLTDQIKHKLKPMRDLLLRSSSSVRTKVSPVQFGYPAVYGPVPDSEVGDSLIGNSRGDIESSSEHLDSLGLPRDPKHPLPTIPSILLTKSAIPINVSTTTNSSTSENAHRLYPSAKRRNTFHAIQHQYMKLEEARLLHSALKQLDVVIQATDESKASLSDALGLEGTRPRDAVNSWLENNPFTGRDDCSSINVELVEINQSFPEVDLDDGEVVI